jgi:excisionase family DNA binding protein
MNQSTQKLLTTHEVAVQLDIHEGHLRNTRAQGTLPIPFVRIGRSIRYLQSDVDAFIEANREEGGK